MRTETSNTTLKELEKVIDHTVFNLLYYDQVQETTLKEIKGEDTPIYETQLKRLGWFLNGYMFSQYAIEYMYTYVKEQLNK